MYSSSTLEGPAKSGCWKQLDYSENRADSLFPLEYRSYVGQAAHHMLQVIVEEGISADKLEEASEEVAHLLTTSGRNFRGHKENPLPAEDVWAGIDIALNYAEHNELLVPNALAFPEKDWRHPNINYTALIDLVQVFEEEDVYGEKKMVCEITDYKTSWQAGAQELETLQRWGQAICVWRQPSPDSHISPDVLRQRVVNLRTHHEFINDIDLSDPSQIANLESWERRIAGLCRAADETKKDNERPASPGVGCLSCPYRHICDAIKPTELSGLLPEELAIELSNTEATRSYLISAIKEIDPETPIKIYNGFVGFKEMEKQSIKPGYEKNIVDEWFLKVKSEIPDELKESMYSLLHALKLTNGNINNLAKAIYPNKAKSEQDARADFIDSLTKLTKYSRFGVWKNDE